jgi:tetratricopeptide (TPR) repeat protein
MKSPKLAAKRAKPARSQKKAKPEASRFEQHPATFGPWHSSRHPRQEVTERDGKSRSSASRPFRWNGRRFLFLSGAAGVILLFLLAVWIRRPESADDPPERRFATAGELKSLDEALDLSRSGENGRALEKLRSLATSNPQLPSLDYLRAFVALQNGDMQGALKDADASIRKGERVSDSLVLKSLAESLGGANQVGFRDVVAVREELLRQAVSADPANAAALAELANLVREQGHKEEALALLKAAQSRLHPVDIHMVVETSIRLLELQGMPDEKLPEASGSGPLPEMFTSVYILLRRGNNTEASRLMEECRKQAPEDLFNYLAADNVFAAFRSGNLKEL